MASFGIETEKNLGVSIYMEQSNKKLQEKNILNNPFNGGIRKLKPENEKDYYAVSIVPVYPKIWLVGLFTSFVAFVFIGFRFSWWYLPGLLFFLLGFFWTRYFFYLMIRIGLRRNEYKGQIRLLNMEDTINQCIKSL